MIPIVGTILDVALYTIGAAALVAIVVIYVRKFRLISSIDTSRVPKHQQEEVRQQLATKRLLRKFDSAKDKTQAWISPWSDKISAAFREWFNKLLHVERRVSLRIARAKLKSPNEQDSSRIQSLLQDAQKFLEKKDFALAEQKYISAISLQPRSRIAYKGLGDVYMGTKDYESAKQSYTYVITLEQQQNGDQRILGECHADLAECFRAIGDMASVRHEIEEVLRLQPNSPRYLDELITVNIQLKDGARAQEAYDRLKGVNPENQKLLQFASAIDQLPKVN